MYIFSKKLNCVRVRHKEQGYILISLMASLVILGLIAISEYMQLVKKQQLERAETAANNIIHIAYTIGDAIYEPMQLFEESKKDPSSRKHSDLARQVKDVSKEWSDQYGYNGEISLARFYHTDKLFAVCGITHPLDQKTKLFSESCVEHNRARSDDKSWACQCASQRIENFPFSNMNKSDIIVMQPLGLAKDETPKSVLLRVPYPKLGGKVDTGLALKMVASLKKNLINTPVSQFAICAGKFKSHGITLTRFSCERDIDSNDALDPSASNQFIYIDIARR